MSTLNKLTLAAAGALSLIAHGAHAQAPAQVKTVFVIAMENHDWVDNTTGQIQGNPAAPFINGLVNGTNPISRQLAYAAAYHNVLATESGNNAHIHPSEPNYIWAEAGTNFGVTSDNDPYTVGGATVQNTPAHLSTLLTAAGISWKAYEEDTDLKTRKNGAVQEIPANPALWTVPLVSTGGNYAYLGNLYNHSHVYGYAAKHDPMVFFVDTDGGNNTTPTNTQRKFYAPLQQLQLDLASGRNARYNWITPDLYNDMHTEIPGGYKPLDGGHILTGDAAQVRQGDDFLSQVVPMIMASSAYKDNGVIILWWDESEAGDSYATTIPEIVISKLAHPNVKGVPYASPVNLSHSSDLRTMQEIFHAGTAFLGDAANMPDLSDLFAPGAIPSGL